ncbi:hypothetical protein KQI41_06810 [Tissierella pigra]|uniref:SPOR domain-containing protein n=1 Tax=Tissierella pigra TaxID=2607614 RepID=A0A6N7XYA1_9FIRM|nr:hypothetical protein [Tissierella pigra]MBU5426123.1 hypothetical protein [Tissierella pigra]MSU00760.1 hypothetical protein [Tissierella pigra]
MWTAVHMTTGVENARDIEKRLRQEGFLVKIKYFTKEGEDELYEILAPEFEAADIQEAMIELGII